MRLGLVGFGSIATGVLAQLARGLPLDGLAVLVRPGAAEAAGRRLGAEFAGVAAAVAVVDDAAGLLAQAPDLVVECAGHSAVAAFVPPVLRAGTDVVLVSVGALADPALEARLRAAAAEGGARLVLPAGAIGAVDLLAALAAAGEVRVDYRGTKPPAAWAGTPAEGIVDLAGLGAATAFFTGTAREAARDYPKNANVAATLALAGAGFDATRVELVADPAASGNIHEYRVASAAAHYRICIENVPTPGNPRTSATTVLSVLREIRNRRGPVAV